MLNQNNLFSNTPDAICKLNAMIYLDQKSGKLDAGDKKD
jgi:hypothetical protein